MKVHQIGQSPNAAKFPRSPTRSVRDILCRKFVLPKKEDQTSPKFLMTSYAPMPVIELNFITLSQATKNVTRLFYTLQYFDAPYIEPLSQSSPIFALMYRQTPVTICQISSRSDNPSTRHLLPNLVDFVDA